MAARFDGPAAPINATDPVKATRAQMAREIKLTEMATGRVTPPDWHREKDPDARSTPATCPLQAVSPKPRSSRILSQPTPASYMPTYSAKSRISG